MPEARKTEPAYDGPFAALVNKTLRQAAAAKRGGRVTVEGGEVTKRTDPNAPKAKPTSEMDVIQQIIEEARRSKTAATQTADDFLGSFVPREQATVDFATGLGAQDLIRLNEQLGSSEQAVGGYGGPVDPVASEAAGAFADAKSREAQYDALDRLKGFTGIEETAEEKYMRLQARMQQEQQMRAGREAALRDLASRGANSGTAELAALVGGQQVTAQNRTLSDLGGQANASRRALAATQAYSDAAGQLSGQTFDERYQTGVAADDVSKFNATTRADYNEKKARFDQDEKKRRFDSYLQTSGQTQQYGRDTVNAQHGVSQTAGAGTATKVGAQLGTGTNDALKLWLGSIVNQKAVDDLKKKSTGLFSEEGLFGVKGVPII
jgi:hypothetical protein